MTAKAKNSTIVAITTHPGKGSLACIRVSGENAYHYVNTLLATDLDITKISPRKISLQWLFSSTQERLDQVTLIRYCAPHSYTGENIVEIFSHGGRIVPNLILEQLCSAGCSLAKPGEFTQRAVLNGKLDLIQAESIAEIVDAESPASLQSFLTHLEGSFSRKLTNLRQKILHVCALLELGLDFAEEDVEFANYDQLRIQFEQIDNELKILLSGFTRGQAMKDGWSIAIIGKPNVGKSSLMNALMKHDRVIVSSVPGTTRDTIEERIQLEGHLFRVIDTAGIRNRSDEIEKIGIERSRLAAQKADIIIFVTDHSSNAKSTDHEIAQECLQLCSQKNNSVLIHVCNKTDLHKADSEFQFDRDEIKVVHTSAIENFGISTLESALVNSIKNETSKEDILYINSRQKVCLENASKALDNAKESLSKGLSAEFIAMDLREFTHQLGTLIGDVATEDILGEIFSNFCIGK